jgi:hypothetical protein
MALTNKGIYRFPSMDYLLSRKYVNPTTTITNHISNQLGLLEAKQFLKVFQYPLQVSDVRPGVRVPQVGTTVLSSKYVNPLL